MEYSQKLLGYRISKYREIRNLTQKELAAKAGVSQSYIANLEIGIGQTINLIKLSNIADVLNVTLDDLLCDSLTKLSKDKSKNNMQKKTKILDEVSTFTDEQIIQFNKILYSFLEYKKSNQ